MAEFADAEQVLLLLLLRQHPLPRPRVRCCVRAQPLHPSLSACCALCCQSLAPVIARRCDCPDACAFQFQPLAPPNQSLPRFRCSCTFQCYCEPLAPFSVSLLRPPIRLLRPINIIVNLSTVTIDSCTPMLLASNQTRKTTFPVHIVRSLWLIRFDFAVQKDAYLCRSPRRQPPPTLDQP